MVLIVGDVIRVVAYRLTHTFGLYLIAISRLIVFILINFEIDIIGAYIRRHVWQTIAVNRCVDRTVLNITSYVELRYSADR